VLEADGARPIRIAYLSGPSEADKVYEELKAGKEPQYFGTNYMRLFLRLALDLRSEALVATWHGGPASVRRIDNFTFVNIPPPRGSGLAYYLGMLWQQLRFNWRFLRFRPDIVLLTGNTEWWWTLTPIKLLGTKFIASFHGMLRRKYGRMRAYQRAFYGLNCSLSLPFLDAAVVTSRDIRDQLEEALGSNAVPIFDHLPSYDPMKFQGIRPVDQLPRQPFTVMYMGRIEENKGVFDLLQIARELQMDRPGEYRFEFCGDGSAMFRLQGAVEEASLEDEVVLHGYCVPNTLRDVLSRSHVVVVPTRSDFEAGFEMTCSEAILAGRPLVTSGACPALHYLKPAAIEVPPDDVAAYRAALEALKDDPELFRAKTQACYQLQEQFYDDNRSWTHAMRQALLTVPALRSRLRGGQIGADAHH
jgi:glycogen synthase